MSRDDAQTGRDASPASQTSRRRSDHRQGRNGRSDGQRPDETRRSGLGHLSGVEPTPRHPQRRADGGCLSRNQMELAGYVKGQGKIVIAGLNDKLQPARPYARHQHWRQLYRIPDHNEDHMKKILPLTLLFLTTITVAAQPRPHIVDHAHSQINFVAEARFISAHGHFDKWEAEVQLDPAQIENSSFKITIEAASSNTSVDRRGNHRSSNDFFDVATYPQITQVTKKITKTGDRKYAVAGDLTLRGVTKQIDIEITQVFYENNRGRFRATFPINRKDFGMTYNSNMNPIEDIVQAQVDINVLDKEATEKARAARPSN